MESTSLDTDVALPLMALSYVFVFGTAIQKRPTASGPERPADEGAARTLLAVYIAFAFLLYLTHGTGWTWGHGQPAG